MKNPLPRLRTFAILTVVLLAAQLASANTALWIGTNSLSLTTNWSDNLNWFNSAGGSPGYTNNDVVFGDSGSVGTAATVNNVADTSNQSLSLNFTNESHSPFSAFHTTLIPAGVVLANAGTLNVGVNLPNNSYLTTVHMAGGGTFAQKGVAMTVKNIGSTNSSGALATFDMSGLTNFV